MKQCKMCETKTRKRGKMKEYVNEAFIPAWHVEVCNECYRWLTRIFRKYTGGAVFNAKSDVVKEKKVKQGKIKKKRKLYKR